MNAPITTRMRRQALVAKVAAVIGTALWLTSATRADTVPTSAADDAVLLRQILYEGRQLPLDRLPELDINGDGKIDINDLVDLNAQIHDHAAPTKKQARPGSIPLVIPRYADQAWWVSDKLKAATALKLRLKALTKYAIEDWTHNVVGQLEALNRDIEAAGHYGMVCGDELSFLRRTVQHAQSSVYLNGFRLDDWKAWMHTPALGREYIRACARQMAPSPHTIQGTVGEWCFSHEIVPIRFSNPFRFVVTPEPGGRIKITMPFFVKLARDFRPSEEEEFHAWWSQNTACLQDFWSRYGVDFELVVDPNATSVFAIHSGPGRSNDESLYFKEGMVIDAQPCSALTHEFAHRMGVPDRYIEKGVHCPKRDPNAPDRDSEIMYNGELHAPYEAQFSLEDLHTIFGSACPGAR